MGTRGVEFYTRITLLKIGKSRFGSLFRGRVEGAGEVGNHEGILPSIEGWARITGVNTIFIDARDPYAHGFQVL